MSLWGHHTAGPNAGLGGSSQSEIQAEKPPHPSLLSSQGPGNQALRPGVHPAPPSHDYCHQCKVSPGPLRSAFLPFWGDRPPSGRPKGCELTAAAVPVKMSSPSVSLSPASGSDPPAAPSESGSRPGKGGGNLSEALQPPPPDAIFLHPRRKPQQQLYKEIAPRANSYSRPRNGMAATDPAERAAPGSRGGA